ncbi:hypothetical protein PtA15_2A452 [Puccinia triticina]|uniref:Uncharacterized protein n=1 Tax=Puccinia triticina TaxID=208348 RepID=A0ABY7CCP9_9BASI|nr:uncharacterized protein PtA15_2A452 [Puccinia triticina]WAQ82138.1 hypothetical protein PtA15_2A452 [Puccinia triticina]WAR52997.1 hypothetical protein PtB15_2B425 [Puccinia triticina]
MWKPMFQEVYVVSVSDQQVKSASVITRPGEANSPRNVSEMSADPMHVPATEEESSAVIRYKVPATEVGSYSRCTGYRRGIILDGAPDLSFALADSLTTRRQALNNPVQTASSRQEAILLETRYCLYRVGEEDSSWTGKSMNRGQHRHIFPAKTTQKSPLQSAQTMRK